jgi:uncharacterized protein (DUF362 family)
MEIPLEGKSASMRPPREEQPTAVEGLGLQFRESMVGYLAVGEADPATGAVRGQCENSAISFDVEIRIEDLGQFLRDPEHPANLAGKITFAPLGVKRPIQDGRFSLFSVEPETGMRKMIYSFHFKAKDGQTYFFRGHKEISDDRGKLDLVEDITRLYTTIYRGPDEKAPVYGAGELYFKLRDAPALVASVEVVGAKSWNQKVAAYTAFASFAYGALRDEYLRELRLFYDTQYENLVLSGKLKTPEANEVPFFLISGTHEKGFPWGDDEQFRDVLLVVGDGKGGYQRFCISDRRLEGLRLDLSRGHYHYRGPLFAVADGYSSTFAKMREKAPPLVGCHAEIDADFECRAFDTVPVSFRPDWKLGRKMATAMYKTLQWMLPGEHLLGIYITPHTVKVRSGAFRISRAVDDAMEPFCEGQIVGSQTFGEAERGSFRNVKEPTLLYSYLCAIRPEQQAVRVQILSRTLRDEKEHWVKDRLDAFLGSVVSRTSSSEMLMQRGKLSVTRLRRPKPGKGGAKLFRKEGIPLLEVNNNHFPTADFLRRIVEVRDPAGARCLALEEDMSLMRLEADKSEKKATVACIKDDDKLKALDLVLEKTEFYGLVDTKQAASGKDRSDFMIAIKPNFMFAYNRKDRTTYTDPELVAHLVKRLRERGYASIKVVEAQSTYGEYFDNRSVREVAEYLGYDERAGYEIVDMTKDATERRHFGPHLGLHPFSRVWRDADFRISFAKNKTHAYAYYTLTLKNIYGALPLANKFKEYHCDRDIYYATLEYLAAFPVDYGLVDAYLSADGPFGIFADTDPNETHTMIGGADLVAVDWVAASKMGINPLISPYMKLAVNAFGKPEIKLIGDASPYQPWLNVPVALTLFTHKGLDSSYFVGNLFYTATAQMDSKEFRHKSRALHVRFLRWLTLPVRRTFFVWTGEKPSWANQKVNELFYWLGR